MKRLLGFVLVMALAAVSAFAEVVPGYEAIIEDFYRRGNYVKIVKNENNVVYWEKSAVHGFLVDNDEFTVVGSFSAHSGKIGDATNFHTRKWEMTADDDGNIIITVVSASGLKKK